MKAVSKFRNVLTSVIATVVVGLSVQGYAADSANTTTPSSEWKEIGDAPGIGAIAAVPGLLFGATSDGNFLVTESGTTPLVWRKIARCPSIESMTSLDGKLYAHVGPGDFYIRDATDSSDAFKRIGHAWVVKSLAAHDGKIYGAIGAMYADTFAKQIMVRDASASDAPWNTMKTTGGAAVPPGVGKVTALDGKFFASDGSKLYVGDPVAADVAWKEIGTAPDITSLASADGKLYAVAKGEKIVVRAAK